MNTKDFTSLLQNPDKVVSPMQTKQLEEVLEEYPYFQAAHALHLKGLKNGNSFKYNKALKVTAAYTADREVLFDFITSKDFLQNRVADTLSGKTTTLVDTEEDLEMGEPLPFTKKEKHSFGEWLQLTSLDEIHFPLKEENPKKKKFDLIDKFIADNPKIKPQKDVPKIAIGESVKFDNKELMTETLAKVYLEQKKYKEAIQAYKILSLKYPEKSGFFADRIKAIERLKADDS